MARHTQALQGLQNAAIPTPTYDEAHAIEARHETNLLDQIINGQNAARMEMFAPQAEQVNQPMSPGLQHGGGHPMTTPDTWAESRDPNMAFGNTLEGMFATPDQQSQHALNAKKKAVADSQVNAAYAGLQAGGKS